ncbi:Histidine kinase-, DNA gyrase B-, and HSP90-like ATPase [Paenibacillus sp. UNCCL117]|uniref:cache domain-containing sensor histidine kinase n=1 Tax=unclassified Paenibacillus TaxID=185978 RepID=UPI00088F9B1F|nr:MULTISPECIES: sensor histidine kinase [unclassified Paenibacillus]SDD03189.1 Histidine kinase-, DNA gyrase B-, and HSP90-like ATPase [Paenibacillus sp. cl123]SFW32355.1 Histidine kinase-, DNA gyrase B-, and HSP90-like ATPase [Paenibacillus sp. UNCCL117]
MRTIQGKMFLAFSIMICLAIIPISYSMYRNATSVIEDNATTFISDSIRRADEKLRSTMEEADQIAKVIVTRDMVAQSLLSDTSAPSYEWFQEKKLIEDYIASMVTYKTYIQRISVIGYSGKVFQSGFARIGQEKLKGLLGKEDLQENRRHVLLDASTENSVLLVRPLLAGGKSIGLCVIEFQPDFMKRVFEIQPLKGSMIGVVDDRGQVIYHSGSNWSGMSDLSPVMERLSREQGSETGGRLRTVDGDTYLTVQIASDLIGWTTIGMVPTRELLREVYQIRNDMILVTGLVLLAVHVISIVLSKQITKNLKRLHNTMKRVREGQLKARPRIDTEDEVGQLSAMFSSMMTHVQELMEETEERGRQKREAEYRALQSQINPHFLYNTLNTINYLSKIQQVPNIGEISESLVELMRFAVDQKRDLIPIREELDLLKRYLSIQKYRFLDRITVNIDAEDQTLDCLIPKLVLQPIVENALLHGFGGLPEREGSITIKSYCRDSDVIIDVTDNGAGIAEEQIEVILGREAERNEQAGTGVGIGNVQDRIRLTFGEEYGLSIVSVPGMLTTVELRLPQSKERKAG